jgi:nicotinate-nucleotide adenylyltransferase
MRIGLYFGSFNPVHIGHLAIAGYLAQFTDLDQVWMVVSPQNPLKEKKSLLKEHHRLAMVQAAIEDYPDLRASDVEFHLPKPSYTSHTLAYLEEKYPQHTFSLLLGSDTLETFHKWKNPEVILNRHQLYVYPRPGYDGGELRNHEKITWVEGVPSMEISATFIRQSVALKKDIRFLMPDKAWKYMNEMHFYE